MKRFRVIVGPGAAQDLLAIRDYISADSPERAIDYYDFLLDRIRELAAFPRRFPVYPWLRYLGNDIRCRPIGEYLCIYAVYKDSVHVLSVRHGKRAHDDAD